jgi:mono/diheme cytochrome c family protein
MSSIIQKDVIVTYLLLSLLQILTVATLHAQPAPREPSLSVVEVSGGKLFMQRCAFCHVAAVPNPTAYGPFLTPELLSSRGDDALRAAIMKGSARMPGFQYQLDKEQVDSIVAYLKVAPPRLFSRADKS